jgi:hypothetical protein
MLLLLFILKVMKTTLTVLFVLLACCSTFASSVPLWVVGIDNDLTDDMEHEGDADDLFYVDPGDYTGVNGYGAGSGFYDLPGAVAISAEALIDPNSTTIGFERAVTLSDPVINMYFQLNAVSAASNARYQLNVETLVSTDNNLEFAVNGTPIDLVSYTSGNRSHHIDFSAADVNAVVGGNVLTVRKVGGTAAYATVDYLRLALVDPNAVFTLGYEGNTPSTQIEFEQEGPARVDLDYYYHAGDYTGVTGLNGVGVTRSTSEPIMSRSDTEGFGRALVPNYPNSNVFFQLSPEERARGHFRFRSELRNLGGGSVHDLRFTFNGVTILELAGISGNTPIDVMFDADDVNAMVGGNVISVEQTAVTGTSPWIQFDYMELQAVIPEPGSAGLIALGGVTLALVGRFKKTGTNPL